MTKEQALYNFWAGFNIDAYDETSVPDNVKFPYITYNTSIGDFNNLLTLSGSIWYRESTWENITIKCNEIDDKVKHGGIIIPYDGGALWIRKGLPFAQRMSDESDDSIRRININIITEYLSE